MPPRVAKASTWPGRKLSSVWSEGKAGVDGSGPGVSRYDVERRAAQVTQDVTIRHRLAVAPPRLGHRTQGSYG